MASVSLAKVSIAVVSNLSAPVQSYSGGFSPMSGGASLVRGTDLRVGQGQVRIYASGRVRNVTAVGTLRTYSMTLQLLSFADCLTLESWENQTCLYRDTYGRKAYGVHNQVQIFDHKGGDSHDVALTVTEITYRESV